MNSRVHASPRGRRPLPPIEGKIAPHGRILCVLGWKLGRAWPRIVIPRGARASDYDLRIAAGKPLLILHAADTSRGLIDEVRAAFLAAGATTVVAIPPVRVVK